MFFLYPEGGLKKIQNIFLSRGNPVDLVITKFKNLTVLKNVRPKMCPVYLKLSHLGNLSERIYKQCYDEINQVFGYVRLKTILYTNWSLSLIYKNQFPTYEKISIIYKVSCHCDSDYVGKKSQNFHLQID